MTVVFVPSGASFTEVGEIVEKLALGLIDLGIEKGDKVSILANTRPEWTYADFAALSVGVVDGASLCDLDYGEDSRAEVDANVVMTGDGGLVEVQATAEQTPLSRASLDELLALAEGGIARLRGIQTEATGA